MNLKSDRLLIGQFKRADLQEWFLIERDPSVRKYILDGSVLNKEQSLAYIEQNIASYAKFANAVLAYGIKVIGFNHIVAGVMPENLASIKILERLDFIYQTDVIYERKTYHKYMFSSNKT